MPNVEYEVTDRCNIHFIGNQSAMRHHSITSTAVILESILEAAGYFSQTFANQFSLISSTLSLVLLRVGY